MHSTHMSTIMLNTNLKPNTMKRFKIQFNVGKAKYLVSFHDGIKKHKDGSDFFDIQIFKSKKALNLFIEYLKQLEYKEVGFCD